MITPFGLLGAYSTAGFKRRLRDEYHRQDPATDQYPEDAAEGMRMGAFLRDFVIDFGPGEIPQATLQNVDELDYRRVNVSGRREQSETYVQGLQ